MRIFASFLPCMMTAAGLQAADPATRAHPYPLVLLQTISSVAVPHDYSINGFSTKDLPTIGDDDHHVHGFATGMEEYSVVHPYLLRTGKNVLVANYHLDLSFMVPADQGPWTFACRMASIDYDPKAATYETEYQDHELLTLTSAAMPKTQVSSEPHQLTGSFTVAQAMPLWSWTHGIPIVETPAMKLSLYAAYADVHAHLEALHAAPAPAAGSSPPKVSFQDEVRHSIAEYITACELRGIPYRFLDDLCYAAAHLSQRQFDEEQAHAVATPKPDPKTPVEKPIAVVDDGPSTAPEPLGADGRPASHLFLTALPPASAVTMTVFAGGTLAKLDGTDGDPLVTFRSNYHDGPWGASGTVKLSAELWFRRTADGQWAIDGVAPMEAASLHLMNGAIGELLDISGF